jgi:hypothetical protein
MTRMKPGSGPSTSFQANVHWLGTVCTCKSHKDMKGKASVGFGIYRHFSEFYMRRGSPKWDVYPPYERFDLRHCGA